MVDGRWSTVDDRWSMVGKGMGKSIGNFFCLILSCLFFYFFFWFWYFILFFCFIKHGGALFNMVVPVCFFFFIFFGFVFLFFCFIIFFNIVLTWKFVEASKASVLYIYI